MKQKISYTAKRLLAALLIAVLLVPAVPKTAYAATPTIDVYTLYEGLVCGKTAKVKLPSGYSYKNVTFKSSNKKVATVSKKGVIKAVRLGVTKITTTYGGKKATCELTVEPKKASDVWLNQENLVFTGQKLTFKLCSDKYDTSQVKLKFEKYGWLSDYIKPNGKCTGIPDSMTGGYSFSYYYGCWSKDVRMWVQRPEEFIDKLMNAGWTITEKTFYNIDAGVPYKILVDIMKEGNKEDIFTPSKLRKIGINLLVDGEPIKNTVTFTAGEHELTMAAGSTEYKRDFGVTYNMKETLEKHDSSGYNEDCKRVLDEVFRVVDSIITEGMTDEQKVRAIHDYLIYHAKNYLGALYYDYDDLPGWAFAAEGVLLRGEGVCASYTMAFYLLCTAAGLPCRCIVDYKLNHEWNRVCVDGSWYYIDCTWDDPYGIGERDTYYLSPTLWSDHYTGVAEPQGYDPGVEEERYWWIGWNLTGEDHDQHLDDSYFE